jgi:electron transfer flavoprotein beta subunit
MNPFDELSIEEAVRMRERKLPISSITTLSIGGAKTTDVLRTALAMGADKGIHVESKIGEAEGVGGLEPLDVAKVLKKAVEDEEANVVILGKQSIDDDSGQTGQMLAGLLGWSQATQASKVHFPDAKDLSTVEVTREVDGGVETLRCKLPVVITTDLRLNEPRYASLPNIMKAKKKPLVKKTLEEMGVSPKQRLKTLKVEEPPPRKGGVKVENVDGLVAKLKELGAI